MEIWEKINAGLLGAGLTSEQADGQLKAFEAAVLAESDHTAYRELADAVSEQIGHLSGDADSWDGEDSELHILVSWLKLSGEWLTEMTEHLVAERIRIAFRQEWLPGGNDVLRVAEQVADTVDPWTAAKGRGSWGTVVRESTGEPVPWQFLAAAEGILRREKEEARAVDGD